MKLAQVALAQREGQLRAFMEGIPTPVAYIDSDATYEYVNNAFVAFSEFERDQIKGRTLREISGGEDFERQSALFARARPGSRSSTSA